MGGLDIVLVDRVRLASVPFLPLLSLTLAAPAPADLSKAPAYPISEPALLRNDGRITASLAGFGSLDFRL